MATQVTHKPLPALAVSVFCENMAMMLSAGIAPEEAAALLCDTGVDSEFHAAAQAVYAHLQQQGGGLAGAMAGSGCFPAYACKMLAVGEQAGRSEPVLRTLADYYASQDRLLKRLKSAVVYPAVLLGMMVAILVVLLGLVLPVFSNVYASLTGDVAVSSFRYLRVAYVVGGAALVVTALCAAVLVLTALAASHPASRERLLTLAEKLPLVGEVSRQVALSRFAQVLANYMASGMEQDQALDAAADLVQNSRVRLGVRACQQQVAAGDGVAAAIMEQKLFEPLYARMLVSGARSGQLDQVMAKLAQTLAADADERMDAAIDTVEPVLSALLTVAVGVTLVAAMLPLIGILGAIG